MKLAYQAIDQNGAAVSDYVEAGTVEEASEALRSRGLFVTEIKPEDRAKGGGRSSGGTKRASAKPGGHRAGGKTKRLRQVAMFSRQLQVLVATGTPLADAVSALKRQTREGAFRDVIGSVCVAVEEGLPLSDALSRHPEYFDEVYCNVILAGESSGSLDSMLDRLATLNRKRAQLRGQLAGVLVYPALLILISIVVTVVMLTLVMPRFTGLFDTLDVPLPATTQALMWASGLLTGYWWAFLIALGAAVTGAVCWLRSEAGGCWLDRALVTVPKLSLLTRSFATAKIARLMGVLVECNIPLLEAIQLSQKATGNSVYTQLMRRAEETVISGEPASMAFADPALIDPAFYEAVRNGEQSGKLGPLLLTIADFLDEDNDVRLRSATSLIEPVILIVLGLVVGGIAISMFLPLFDLSATAGGGCLMVRWLRQPGVIGLDIGRRSVKAAQLTRRGPGWAAHAVARFARRQADAPVTPAEAAYIADVLRRQGFRGQQVALAAPHGALVSSLLDLPPDTTEAATRRVVQMEIGRVHRIDPEGLTCCWSLLPRSEHRGKANQGFCWGLAQARVEPLLELLEGAGLETVCVEPGALALMRSCTSGGAEAENISGVMDLGAAAARLILMHQGQVVHERVLPEWGAGALVRGLADRLGTPPRLAERAMYRYGVSKVAGGAALAAETGATISSLLGEMIEQVALSFSFVSHQYPNAELGPLMLTGGVAGMPGLASILAEELELQVAPVAPGVLVEGLGGHAGSQDTALIAALGLAMWKGGGDAP